MQKLTTVAAKTIEASARSPAITSSLPLTTSDIAPAESELACELIGRTVISPWIPMSGPRELKRALTGTERRLLDARSIALRRSLVSYLPVERGMVQGFIAATLGGFRNVKQRGEGAEAMIDVTAAVLRDFPAWVIRKASGLIAQGKAGLDSRYPPNDSDFHTVCERILLPYRRQLAEAEALLNARVEEARPLWDGPKRMVDLFNKWEPAAKEGE